VAPSKRCDRNRSVEDHCQAQPADNVENASLTPSEPMCQEAATSADGAATDPKFLIFVTTQVSLSRALEFGDEPFWVCGEGVEHIPTLFFRR
jgi:hypothetical protein